MTYHEQLQQQHQQKQQALEPRSDDDPAGDGGGLSCPIELVVVVVVGCLCRSRLSFSVHEDGPRDEILLIYKEWQNTPY